MTSCDGNLMKFIPVQLEAITTNLSNRQINFYLFHDGKDKNYVNKLKKIKYNNINFRDIVIENADKYDYIAIRGYEQGGGTARKRWGGAAYYSLCAYKYLPEDMDRILYIDAGDIMIISDIDEYYFSDFCDKMFIVTGTRFKTKDGQFHTYEKNDLLNPEYIAEMSKGTFNSGSYVINLEKMRKKKYDLEHYCLLSDLLYEGRGKPILTYMGDQGFISLIFANDFKLFAYPEILGLGVPALYMPYNFCMWYYNGSRAKAPHSVNIVHFNGPYKPWLGNYPIFLKRFQDVDKLRNIDDLKLGQAQYYYMWHEYAIIANARLTNSKIKGL